MLHIVQVRAVVLSSILFGGFALLAADQAHADSDYLGVVTIYNKTGIQLHYQLRVQRNSEWSDWEPRTHEYPNGGYHWHTFGDVERIEIRFDRIGGDDEYTKKIYNLKFNRVDPDKNVCRHTGRPYKFQFDRGGRLLDLHRYGW